MVLTLANKALISFRSLLLDKMVSRTLLSLIAFSGFYELIVQPRILSHELLTTQFVIIILGSILGLHGLSTENKFELFIGFAASLLEFFYGLNLFFIYLTNNTYNLGTLYYSVFLVVLSFLASVSIYLYSSLRISIENRKRALLEEPRSEYAVELIDVVKNYVVGPIVVPALRGVSLKVKRGEFVAIMGPSGSGKSTLLNMIGAIDRPTSGKVLIDGIDISTLNDDELAHLRNKKIGFIFQAYNLINRTTVLRNVELPTLVAGIPKKERVHRALEMLRIVGLENEANRSPKYLSGGQQQRVAIARALINNPALILADEPTGNLDSKTGFEIMNYLRKLNREFGTTIIVVTHARDVAEMADRILHIRDGKIVDEEILRKGE